MEKYHNYFVQNSILVKVDDKVNKRFLDALEFHIGYFKTEAATSDYKYRVNIFPFSEKVLLMEDFSYEFHLSHGSNKAYYNPRYRTAIIKVEMGYDMYVDGADILTTQILQLLLLRSNITLIHAAAVADSAGRVLLFPGAGGVGKTAIINYFVKERGYRILGDDIVGIDNDGNCYCYPRKFVLKPYHLTVYSDIFKKYGLRKNHFNNEGRVYYGNSKIYHIINFIFYKLIIRNIPFTGILQTLWYRMGLHKYTIRFRPSAKYFTVPISEIFGADSVIEKGRIDKIVYLLRYSKPQFEKEIISNKNLKDRMFSTIHHEWTGSHRDFVSMGALEMIDLKAYYDKTSDIIDKFLCKCNDSVVLKIPSRATPQELQKNYLDLIR